VLVDEVRDHPDHDHAYREIDPLCHNLKSARTVPARASLLPCFACQGSQTGKSGSAGGFSFLSPSIKKPCLFSGFGEKPCNLFPDVASMYVISRGFPNDFPPKQDNSLLRVLRNLFPNSPLATPP
jgi:hypothetical protein